MTDIWDEKPEWETISESYPRIAMDAWLDKVGRFIGNLENDIAELKETERNWLEQEKAYLSCIDELKEKADKWDEVEPLLPKITAHLLVEYLKKAAESSVFMDDPSSSHSTLKGEKGL